jgi:RNA polymerase sigma-70 factor (ECF subfamily)
MEVYRRYGPALLRKCERMLQNRQEAEDVVQALFVDLLQKGRIDVDLPYLYRAATNRCLNHLRDAANRSRLLEQHDPALRGAVRSTCDEQIISIDLLLKLLDRLDKKSATIVAYHYFDELGVGETAELMGISRRVRRP